MGGVYSLRHDFLRPLPSRSRGLVTMRFAQLAGYLVVLALVATPSNIVARQSFPPEPIRPIAGSLVLAGHGNTPDAVLDAFLHLGGGFEVDIVVVAPKGKSRSAARWKLRGARSVTVIHAKAKLDKKLTLALLKAGGVWFEDKAEALVRNTVSAALLRDVLARGGVVGGQGVGSMALANLSVDKKSKGFGLLPGSRVHLLNTSDESGSARELDPILTGGDGLVGWQIPKETALVIHYGRRVGAIGNGSVVVQVAGAKGWPERRASIRAVDVFEYGDELSYDVDLLAWRRSAQDRMGPLFPPENAPTPKVPRGTLVLSGGGGVQSPTWNRFIEAAGGKDATIVCIPSAAEFDPGDEPRSYSARELREHGCANVFVIHTNDPDQADKDPRLLALLEKASGVWIDGGRTYRMMDSFQHTKSHALMRNVLTRGGVVGGSSAGCQVAGDFLVRGDPRTNRTLVHDGYTTGLGLLEGVILDAHFLQRNRHEPFVELMKNYPQMLGIGVDEDTALIVRGTAAEVIGDQAVSFYASGSDPVVLRKGQQYDLEKRSTAR